MKKKKQKWKAKGHILKPKQLIRGGREVYIKYLKSFRWYRTRLALFAKRGKKCEECESLHEIQVHHITYGNLGNEKYKDLKILCIACHTAEHDRLFEKQLQNLVNKRIREQERVETVEAVEPEKPKLKAKVILRRNGVLIK